MSEDHRELQAHAVEADATAQRYLLTGDRVGAEPFLHASELLYRASWDVAPPGGYGRLVGMLKAAILRGAAAPRAGASAAAQDAVIADFEARDLHLTGAPPPLP